MKKSVSNIVKNILLTALFLLLANNGYGQSFPWQKLEDRSVLEVSKNNLLSPQALQNSPQKVDVNASGSFNLSLPMMVVPGRGGLNFNLSLTYTPGIKATDEASWVGLGWDLNIGKVVRSVISLMDNTINKKEYYDYVDDVYHPDDLNRDLYNVSCPAGDGKVWQFDPNPSDPNSQYNFQLEEWKPWQISYSPIDHGFTVTTEDGTRYIFNLGAPGASSYNGSISSCYLSFASEEPFMQWYLTAILSPDYIDGNSNVDPTDAGLPNNKGNWIRIYWGAFEKYFYDRNQDNSQSSCGIDPQISLNFISYPTHIVTPTYVAKFEVEAETSNPICAIFGNHWDGMPRDQDDHFDAAFNTPSVKKRLKSIKLYRHDATVGVPPADLGTALQEITFDYNYNWTIQPTDYQETRTTLNSVTIKAGSITLNPYSFTYNPGPDKSWYASYSPNHPYYYGPMFDPNRNRIGFLGWYTDPKDYQGQNLTDITYLMGQQIHGQLWNLKTVTYPSGGSLTFEYEYNHYVIDFSYLGKANPQLNINDESYHGTGCGPRLVYQKVYSGSSTTEYGYSYGSSLENGTFYEGLGRIYCNPIEYSAVDIDFKGLYPPIPPATSFRIWLFHQSPHNVLYQQVLEKKGTRNGSNWIIKSQIKSTFSSAYLNENIAPNSYPRTSQDVLNKSYKKRGLLKTREYLDENSNLVKKEEFSVSENILKFDGDNPIRISCWKSAEICTTAQDGVNSFSSIDYSPYNGLPGKITETNSDGTIRTTRIKYPLDYSNGTGSDPMVQAIVNLKAKNMFSAVIEKTVTETKPGMTEQLVNASLTKFVNVAAFPARIYPSEVKNFTNSTSIPYSSFTQSSVSGSSFISDSRYQSGQFYELYDDYGNILQSKDANGCQSATKWGYNNSVPIATVSNSTNINSAVIVFDDGNISGWDGGSDWVNNNGIYQQQYVNTTFWNSPNKYNNTSLTNAVLECDIRFDNYGNKRYAGLMKYVDATHYIRFELRKTNNSIRIQCQNGSNSYYQDASFTFAENKWYHLKGVLNGSNASLYLDGKLMKSFTNSNAAIGAGKIGLCTDQTIASFDNVRYYPNTAIVTSQSYGPSLLLVNQKSEENGNRTYYDYDAFGRPKSTYGPTNVELSKFNYSTDLRTISKNIYILPAQEGYEESYTDAFGKPVSQKIKYQTDSYINTYQYYDIAGRPYLSYKPSGIATEFKYYNDPLDRIEAQGVYNSSVWGINNGHALNFSYESNTTDDEVLGYPMNTLYKTISSDEQPKTKVEYKDIFGNTVQTVTDPGGLNLTTKYKYDLPGNPIKVTSPNGLVSTYTYNTIGQITQKTTPDAGTVNYLYDNNGNLRFIKDANHTGNPNVGMLRYENYVTSGRSGSLPALTMPGKVTLSGSITAGSAYVYLKANGVVVASINPGAFGNMNVTSTFILPKGTYTYEIVFTASGSLNYSISCNNNYEFVYNKYDTFNRLTETGEYFSTTTSSFTPTNANNTSFPNASEGSDRLKTQTFIYDALSSDPLVVGQQRNLSGRISSATSYCLGIEANTTFYSYDDYGRVEWIVQKPSGITAGRTIKYEYDLQGKITKKSYIDPGSSTRNHYTFYEYDLAGRILKVYTDTDPNGTTKVKEADYTYNNSGTVQQLKLGNTPAQTVDYTYNERDWLTGINDPNNIGSSDKFAMTLGYNNISGIGSLQGAQPQWNGNISWAAYKMMGVDFTPQGQSPTPYVGWTYSYDKADRLKSANFGYNLGAGWYQTTAYDETNYVYDPNGNIKSLDRNGQGGAPMDNLTYYYEDQGTHYTFSLNPNRDIMSDDVWQTHPYSGSAIFDVLDDGAAPNDADYVFHTPIPNMGPRIFEVGFPEISELY